MSAEQPRLPAFVGARGRLRAQEARSPRCGSLQAPPTARSWREPRRSASLRSPPPPFIFSNAAVLPAWPLRRDRGGRCLPSLTTRLGLVTAALDVPAAVSGTWRCEVVVFML
ncbi:Hypothetical predicted protein [Podarcis lilfordi]|uniref:Uncharacterized protein n=1 Tax=Podarcis lilfordi TaxID=74358 RepID=A0AA35K7S8_9SAUR|nr:Hypothetical predicted protein [Podarcis lilfordi]